MQEDSVISKTANTSLTTRPLLLMMKQYEYFEKYFHHTQYNFTEADTQCCPATTLTWLCLMETFHNMKTMYANYCS